MTTKSDHPPAEESGKESIKAESEAAAPSAANPGQSDDTQNDAPAAAETAEAVVVATSATDGQRPSDSSQPSSKKRRSGIQLNKDDHPEGRTCNSDDDDDLNEEGGKRSDPFKRAPEGVLKKRKIVKASDKWSNGGNKVTSGGGAFASVKLATNNDTEKSTSATGAPSVFGSSTNVPAFGSAAGPGFGSAAAKFGASFGGVSSGFGALKQTQTEKAESNDGDANSSTGFGGGFGAVSSGFGSLKSSTTSFGFGSTSNGNANPSTSNAAVASSTNSGLAGTFAKPPKSSSPTKFPTSSVVDTANGEQDEDCLCQVRAKLFKMVPEDEAADTPEDGSALKGDVPSVPSTSGRMELVKAKKEADETSPENGNESPGQAEGSTEGDDTKPKLVQKEAGIGPVRILQKKPPLVFGDEEKEAKDEPTPMARVVQRQETSGGQATKVILNIRLVPETSSVIRRGDKFVQLNAPNSDGTLESSLFKVKTTADADLLEKNLKAMLGVSEENA